MLQGTSSPRNLLFLIILFLVPSAPEFSFIRAGGITEAESGEKKRSAQPGCTQPGPCLNQKLFTLGGDLRTRGAYQDNIKSLNNDQPGSGWFQHRHRLRGGLTLSPWKNLDVNTRLAWEFQHTVDTETDQNPDWSYGFFDVLNLNWRNVLNLPLTITAGRQEIVLGSGWLVSDGTPGDGTRSRFLDAVRGELEIRGINSSLNMIYIDQGARADSLLPTIQGDETDFLVEEDQRGAVLHFSNFSLESTDFSAFFLTRDSEARTSTGWSGTVYAAGGGVRMRSFERWEINFEAALQNGSRNGRSISASGASGEIIFQLEDARCNSFNLGFEYYSGDDPATAADERFDILWGRDNRWSKIYPYIIELENGRKAQFENTARIKFGWETRITNRLNSVASYNLLFAPVVGTDTYTEELTSGTGSFRGHLWSARLNYRLNQRITGHFLAEKFHPGGYYSPSRRDSASIIRIEIFYHF